MNLKKKNIRTNPINMLNESTSICLSNNRHSKMCQKIKREYVSNDSEAIIVSMSARASRQHTRFDERTEKWPLNWGRNFFQL